MTDDPSFRDRLAEALADVRVTASARPSAMSLIAVTGSLTSESARSLLDALLPVIAAEVEARVQAAWDALPESVAGDAAPEGTPLADRIRAVVMERDEARAGWKRCHERHMTAEAAANQRAAEAVRPFEELFSGDPDTPCRTTWRREPGWSLPGATDPLTECVEVPMDDLRDAFDRAAALAQPAPEETA